jgi:hypothetical protein
LPRAARWRQRSCGRELGDAEGVVVQAPQGDRQRADHARPLAERAGPSGRAPTEPPSTISWGSTVAITVAAASPISRAVSSITPAASGSPACARSKIALTESTSLPPASR